MNKIVKNAAVVAVGGVFAKVLGAVYRVPLTAALGAEGIGVYQMVFPVYCVLLTLSSTGIPTGVAKLVAKGENVLLKSLVIFGVIGLIGTLFMFFGAKAIAAAQGNLSAANAYKALAPSVFIVSVMSVLRGYHQGNAFVVPLTVSQVIEQSVKLTAGLFLCLNFGRTLAQKAALATLAVTVSEAAALVAVLLFKIRVDNNAAKATAGRVISAILPVALTTITLPLVKAVDSFTAIRLIGGGVNEATAKFGLYGGVAEPIVALPVSVCFAIAVSGLPFIAKGSARSEKKVVVYTLILSVFGAAAVFIFAPVAIKLLYPRLTGEDASAAVRLIRILTPSVVGLSVVQTLSTVFIAKNRSFVAPLALIAGAAVKVAVTFAVVPVPEIGVYGYAISDIFCYFVALIVFLLYSIKEKNLRSDKENATVRRWTWGKKRRSFGKRV